MPEYDRERFESMPDPELVCPICHCILDNPQETICRHVFCKVCIETWIKSRVGGNGSTNRCPTCRKYLHIGDIKQALPLLCNLISKLRVKCINCGNGCQVIVAKEMITDHEKTCGYELSKCRYVGCGKSFLRKDKEKHEDECEMKLELCSKDCELLITRRDMKDHNCVVELKKRLKDKESELRRAQDMINDILSGQVRSMANAVRQNTIRRPNIAAEIFANVRNHIQSYARAIAHDRESTARFASSLMSSLQPEQEPNSPDLLPGDSMPSPDRDYSPASTYSPGYNPTPEYSPSSPHYSPPNDIYRAEYRPTPIPRYSPYSPPRHWPRIPRRRSHPPAFNTRSAGEVDTDTREVRYNTSQDTEDLNSFRPLFSYIHMDRMTIEEEHGHSGDEDGDEGASPQHFSDHGSYRDMDGHSQSTRSSPNTNRYDEDSRHPSDSTNTDREASDGDISDRESSDHGQSVHHDSDNNVSDDQSVRSNSYHTDQAISDRDIADDDDDDDDNDYDNGDDDRLDFGVEDNHRSRHETSDDSDSDKEDSVNFVNSDQEQGEDDGINVSDNEESERDSSRNNTALNSPVSTHGNTGSVHSISDDSHSENSSFVSPETPTNQSNNALDRDPDDARGKKAILFISDSSLDEPESLFNRSEDDDNDEDDDSLNSNHDDRFKIKHRQGAKWSRMRSPASSSDSSSSFRNKTKSNSQHSDSDHSSSESSSESHSSSSSSSSAENRESKSKRKKKKSHLPLSEEQLRLHPADALSDADNRNLEKMSEGSFEPDYTEPESDVEILDVPRSTQNSGRAANSDIKCEGGNHRSTDDATLREHLPGSDAEKTHSSSSSLNTAPPQTLSKSDSSRGLSVNNMSRASNSSRSYSSSEDSNSNTSRYRKSKKNQRHPDRSSEDTRPSSPQPGPSNWRPSLSDYRECRSSSRNRSPETKSKGKKRKNDSSSVDSPSNKRKKS